MEPEGTSESVKGRVAVRSRFEELALPHLDSVYRTARSLAIDESEADDLVQETFVRAFRSFEDFELRKYGARPWLLRILYNVFYNAKRQQRRRPTLLDDMSFDQFADELDDAQWSVDDLGSICWDRFDEELKRAVGELLPEYRVVLLLWAIEGLTYKEIARVCECALGTVMSRLYRARQILGKELHDYARERGLSTKRIK